MGKITMIDDVIEKQLVRNKHYTFSLFIFVYSHILPKGVLEIATFAYRAYIPLLNG